MDPTAGRRGQGTNLGHKPIARMTPAQKEKLKQAEQNLIAAIGSLYPIPSGSPPCPIDLQRCGSSAASTSSRSYSGGILPPTIAVPSSPLSAYSCDFSDGQTLVDGEAADGESPGTCRFFNNLNKKSYVPSGDEEPWKVGDDFQFPIVAPKGDPWEVAYNLTQKEDQAMCAIWKEEIDKLLVFAGLFAATVVAFLIVSYQLLQPTVADMQDVMQTTLVALVREYQAAGNLSPGNHVFLSADRFRPSPSVLRMNVTWFLSMTLSLSTVLIGTICLQWIREYQRETRLGPKQAFAVRQMRYDGLEYWKVPFICSWLSLCLQVALLLFFWGLIEFLHSLNTTVTLINALVIGVVALFMVATIILPAFQCIFSDNNKPRGHQCAYKSPQARIFSVFAFWITIQIIKVARWCMRNPVFLEKKRAFLADLLATEGWNWVAFDNQWQRFRMLDLPTRHGSMTRESRDIPHALAWLGKNFSNDHEAMGTLYHLLHTLHPSTSFQTLKALGGDYEGVLDFQPSAHEDEVLSDLQSAFLLRDMVEKNPELQTESILFHRMELLIRIANHIATDKTREISPEVWALIEQCVEGKRCSVNPFKDNQDYSALPDYVVRQILMAFQTYLQTIKADTKFPHDLWRFVEPMIYQVVKKKIRRLDSTLEEDLASFNEKLESYISRVEHRRLPNRTYHRFRMYVNQFKDSFAGKDHQEKGHFTSFFDSLRSLERKVNTHPILEPPPPRT